MSFGTSIPYSTKSHIKFKLKTMIMKSLLKNKINVLFASLLIGGTILSSCSDDSDPEPLEMIKIDVTVSANEIGAGGTLTFKDLSTGVLSRTWSFPGGDVQTSADSVVRVTFAKEGPIVCSVELNLNDETTETTTIPIQVGTEQFAFSIFSFEDATEALASLKAWNPTAGASTLADWTSSAIASFEVDDTQGAEGTSSSLKVTISKAGEEVQVFSKENWDADFNGKLDKTKMYTLSFWAKSDVANSIETLVMENEVVVANPDDAETKFYSWATNAQEWNGYLWNGPNAVDTDWTEFSFDIDPSDQPYDVAENAYVMIKFATSQVGTFHIDEISLKEK